MTIGELFGTLQESVTKSWRQHLQTHKYSAHMALDDYYKDMPEKVDALIEAWQANHDIVDDYVNAIDDDKLDPLAYFGFLRDYVVHGREEHLKGETELESLCDDILSLIDSTIYKLRHLTESAYRMKGISEYINEKLG